jgi:hypothetical protein
MTLNDMITDDGGDHHPPLTAGIRSGLALPLLETPSRLTLKIVLLSFCHPRK